MERAAHFAVSKHCIRYALKKLNIPQKKTHTYKEQCPVKREVYLAALQMETNIRGKTPVYVNESGFATAGFHRYAYAPKGNLPVF